MERLFFAQLGFALKKVPMLTYARVMLRNSLRWRQSWSAKLVPSASSHFTPENAAVPRVTNDDGARDFSDYPEGWGCA
jgi:hypothetical protein